MEESIEVLTGQHIKIQYRPASVVQRIAATLIDFAFKAMYFLAIFTLIYEADWGNIENSTSYVLMTILSIPFLFYHFLFEVLMAGQTPGKMLMKTRVTNVDGSTPGFGAYFLRWVLRPIDMILNWSIGLFLVVFTKNHQRLGDLAAGTTVIRVKTQEPEINVDYYDFGPDYRPTYPQVERLTLKQAELIMDLLELPVPKDEYEDDGSIDRLSLKVQTLLNISTVNNSRQFLQIIVKDYNYYASLGF